MAVILRYFSEFGSFRRALHKMVEDIPILCAFILEGERVGGGRLKLYGCHCLSLVIFYTLQWKR